VKPDADVTGLHDTTIVKGYSTARIRNFARLWRRRTGP
jgi:hypothetical protein